MTVSHNTEESTEFSNSKLSNFSEIGFPEMAAALAHEIKNPAAIALAHANLMRQEVEKDSELGTHICHIEQAISDICDLVHEMLFAIYNCTEPYEVDLYQILSEMLDTYRVAWPGIAFSLDTCAPLTCYGQESSLRMVFSNLMKNAVEAITEKSAESEDFKGQISIATQHVDNCLNIVFHNNGVFDNREEKPLGNGLGLAICRHLLRQLNGNMEICNKSQEGWTATVSLPKS